MTNQIIPRLCAYCFRPLNPSARRERRFCNRDCSAKGKKNGKTPIPFAQRFWKRVSVGDPDDCWVWEGHLNQHGYGIAYTQGEQKILAHRASYLLAHGEGSIGDLCVLHRCDNPPCVNPAHLFLGTRADNMADMDQKGRRVLPPVRQGEDSSRAILTDAKVKEMRQRCANGETQVSVAADMKVGRTLVGEVVRGNIWKHLL